MAREIIISVEFMDDQFWSAMTVFATVLKTLPPSQLVPMSASPSPEGVEIQAIPPWFRLIRQYDIKTDAFRHRIEARVLA